MLNFSRTPSPLEDGVIAITKDRGTAIARIGCAAVRERQTMIVREALWEVARLNGGRLAVGLEEVTALSAACLGDLLSLQRRCEEMGGSLVLFGLCDSLRRALRPTGLLRQFTVADDHRHAVETIREGRAAGSGVLGRITGGRRRGAA